MNNESQIDSTPLFGLVKNIAGQRFGKLTVISYAGKGRGRLAMWNCICDCGNPHLTAGTRLRNGTTDCCKVCSNKKIASAKITHGMCDTTESNSWRAMMGRCYDPNNWKFPTYGAVGIFACEGLKNPVTFHQIMGLKPDPKHTIDRFPKLTGSYVCGMCDECIREGHVKNVRWATQRQQAQHQSKNILFSYHGEDVCLAEIARREDVRSDYLYYRVVTKKMELMDAVNQVRVMNRDTRFREGRKETRLR